MTFEAIMKAEMKRRWPEEPRAAGKRSLRRERRKSDVKTTVSGKRVRCMAYAIKFARGGQGVCGEDAPVEDWFAGTGGQEKSAEMKRQAILEMSSKP
jgi:hypothetical protein